ncbi:MAG: hypothetical protein WBN43_13585, partial [Thiogranum sp.]
YLPPKAIGNQVIRTTATCGFPVRLFPPQAHRRSNTYPRTDQSECRVELSTEKTSCIGIAGISTSCYRLQVTCHPSPKE